jgi:ribosomal protein S18 acetylase RimI-like enzyme
MAAWDDWDVNDRLARRIQAYLRASAAHQYDAAPAPPFTCFFHPHNDFPHFNYAIPDQCEEAAVEPDYGPGIAALQAQFAARRRRPRLEFVEACTPRLAAALEQAGFSREGRYGLMVCTPDRALAPPHPVDAVVQRLEPSAPVEQLAEFLRTQAIGFGAAEPVRPSKQEIGELRVALHTTTAVWARVGQAAAAVAVVTAPAGGVAELAGVATLPDYRRRGLGRAVSAAAVQAAFAGGVKLVCLTAADAAAERIYAAIGFRVIGAGLVYIAGDR